MKPLFSYNSPDSPRLETIYAIQINNGNKTYSEPTFHVLPNIGHTVAQAIANVIGKEVRLTKPETIFHDVNHLSAEYFRPKYECNRNCRPAVMSYDKDCPIHGWQ